MKTNELMILLAEVPGAARVNLKPAEHLLLCKHFFGFQAPQAQMWEGWGSNLHQNLPWTGGGMRAKFHQDLCRGLDFCLPSTYQQTNRDLYAHLYIERLHAQGCLEKIISYLKRYFDINKSHYLRALSSLVKQFIF